VLLLCVCTGRSPTNEFHLVTGGADQTLRVWDIRRAGALMILDQYNQADPMINTKYINTSEMRSKRDVSAHDGPITCISWMNEGMNIMSSGTDKKIRLWDARSGRNSLVSLMLITLSDEMGRSDQLGRTLTSSPSACDCVASQLNYGGISVGTRTNRFSVSCNDASVFFPNNLHLHEYDVFTGRLLRKFKGHFERILCCTTNPVTQDVYSAGIDRHILVWTPKADEQTYAKEELEEQDELATVRQREMEAQDIADREAQMRIMQVRRGASARISRKGVLSYVRTSRSSIRDYVSASTRVCRRAPLPAPLVHPPTVNVRMRMHGATKIRLRIDTNMIGASSSDRERLVQTRACALSDRRPRARAPARASDLQLEADRLQPEISSCDNGYSY
jgi:hypothetical protein